MRKGTFQSHVRKHKGVKKVDGNCKYCDFESFGHKRLFSHLQSNHPEIFKFKCSIHGCTLGYHTIRGIKRHQALEHPGGKPMTIPTCPYCGYTTTWKENMRGHIRRVHESKGEKLPRNKVQPKPIKKLGAPRQNSPRISETNSRQEAAAKKMTAIRRARAHKTTTVEVETESAVENMNADYQMQDSSSSTYYEQNHYATNPQYNPQGFPSNPAVVTSHYSLRSGGHQQPTQQQPQQFIDFSGVTHNVTAYVGTPADTSFYRSQYIEPTRPAPVSGNCKLCHSLEPDLNFHYHTVHKVSNDVVALLMS